MNWHVVSGFCKIVLFDLILSGDNAVVIALAAHRLPPKQRRAAIVWGAGGAVGLRVLLTAGVALLLNVVLVRAVGGVLLAWIALRLLISEENEPQPVKTGRHLWEAIRIIITADFIMSLDNMLAVGAAAEGNVWLLLLGLGLSIPLLMTGSALIAALMDRLPLLVYVGSGILAWTAGKMIADDGWVHHALVVHFPSARWLLAGGLTLLALTAPQWWRQGVRMNVAPPREREAVRQEREMTEEHCP